MRETALLPRRRTLHFWKANASFFPWWVLYVKRRGGESIIKRIIFGVDAVADVQGISSVQVVPMDLEKQTVDFRAVRDVYAEMLSAQGVNSSIVGHTRICMYSLWISDLRKQEEAFVCWTENSEVTWNIFHEKIHVQCTRLFWQTWIKYVSMSATNENDVHPENLCHMRILTVLSLYLKHICSEDYPPLMHVAEFRAKLSRKGTKISSSPGVSMNLAQLRLGLSEREPRVLLESRWSKP